MSGRYSRTCGTSGHTRSYLKIFHSMCRTVRHVPSIDRGRRLARVYKPSLSSIKRVLGCNLAITRTCRALATHHPYDVHTSSTCVWTRLRARARMYVCASHGGCVFAGVSTRFLVAFVSVAARPVSNRFHQDRTSRRIRRTPGTPWPRERGRERERGRKKEFSYPFYSEWRCGQHESIHEYEMKKTGVSASLVAITV